MIKENFGFEKERNNWKNNPELIGPVLDFLKVLSPKKREVPLKVLKVESMYDGDKIIKIHVVIDSEGEGDNIDFYLESDALETFKKRNNIR